MFFQILMKDTIKIPPADFKRKGECVNEQIRGKYTDRVISGVGLCVALRKVVSADEVTIPPRGDGSCLVEVVFQLCVFRPFRDEVLVGTPVAQSPQGVRFSLGFFDEVYVPSDALFAYPAQTFDQVKRHWLWHPKGKDAESYELQSFETNFRLRVKKVLFRSQELFVEQHRMQVTSERQSRLRREMFEESSPESDAARPAHSRRDGAPTPSSVVTNYITPMSVHGTMAVRGLGEDGLWGSQRDAVVERLNAELASGGGRIQLSYNDVPVKGGPARSSAGGAGSPATTSSPRRKKKKASSPPGRKA